MIEALLSGAFLLLLTYGFIHWAWNFYTSRLSWLPGPPAVPILGNVPILENEPYKLFRQLQGFQKKFSYTFRGWMTYVPMVFTGDAVYVKSILSSKEMLKKSTLYWILFKWLGTGLLTSHGRKWKKRRRLLTPAFHFNILNDYVNIFLKHSKVLVEKFNLECDTGRAIDVQVPTSLASLDVMCEAAMGVEVYSQQCVNSQYTKSMRSMKSHLQRRQRSPWLWPNFIYKLTSAGKCYYKDLNVVHDFTIDLINKRIKSRKLLKEDEKSKPRKKVFIDLLLDLYDQGEIDIDGVREEVDTFMFEGHDTMATALGWTLHLLGRNPEVQKKLHAEIDSIDKSNPGKVVDTICELKYLEYVIKEGLRLHPPVAMIGRTVENDTAIGRHVIPSGTQILLDVYALHSNPEYWDEPEKFIPERFGDAEFFKRNPYSYVPFSAGPRNCIGQKFALLKLKIFLFNIASNFRFTSIQDKDDIEECFEIVHNSSNGLLIKVSKRCSPVCCVFSLDRLTNV